VPEGKLSFSPISASDSNFNPPPNFGGLILEIRRDFCFRTYRKTTSSSMGRDFAALNVLNWGNHAKGGKALTI
jgi:hypothetical protein